MRGFQYVIVLMLFSLGAAVWLVDGADRPTYLYDADLNRLAVTYTEGFCAGQTYFKSHSRGDKEVARRCREAMSAPKKVSPRSAPAEDGGLTETLEGFCEGFVAAGYPIPKEECLMVLEDGRLWPTYNGRLSRAFTGKYPWPGDLFPTAPTDNPDRPPSRGM